MNQSLSLTSAGDPRNPGFAPSSGMQPGITLTNIVGSYHGPRKPKRVAKSPAGDIVGKATKPAAPGKKSATTAEGAGKAK